MIQDLTQDEMLWRYENLMHFITDEIEENNIEVQSEDKDVDYISDLISGSLVYLQKAGAIKIVLHKGKDLDGAMFTASREECINTSWIEPEEDELKWGSRPNDKEIPVPILFEEKGNENYTHISIVFEFPNSNIGRLCKKMITYLRYGCKKDVNVINSVVFLKYCVKEELYTACLRRVMFWAFIEDHWTSSWQTPSEVDDIIGMVMEVPAQDVYDPFMRTGTNLFYANGKYHAQATNKYFMYATMLWAGVLGLDTEHIEYADCVSNWDAGDCDFIMVTPEFGKEVVTSDGETESISSFSLEKVLGSMNIENRRALLLLPASALSSNGKTAKLRHDITEANLLDTVVMLPANVFNKTSIAATIIYLKTGRKQGDPITFVDFSSFIEEKEDLDEEKDTIDIERVKEAIDKNDKNFINEVSVSDVREREYEWYAPNYMDYVKQVQAGYRKILLSKLLEPLEETDGSALIGCVVREDYLVSNPFEEYVQNPKPFKSSFISNLCEDKKDDDDDDGEDDESDKYYSYKGTPFVVQYGEKELKTYYHEFELGLFREVNVPKSCHAYRINTDLIDINYLRLRLAQIDKESNGELRRNGIKRWEGGKGINPALLIPLSLEEQRHIYEDAKLNEAVEKARKEGLDKAIDSMKQEYMMEVRMRKHDMKPFLSQLDSQAKLITFYLDKIKGNDDTVSAIRQKLTGISNAVSELRLHLNRLTEEDIYGTPEVVNPLDILKELTGTFSNYSVALDVDMVALKEAQIETPEIFISKVDFSTLATTIIENAVTHAFTGEGKEPYKVLITLSYSAKMDVFTIDFKNNGNPMPQGMDKFRYGLKGEKGAKSHGTGLGGYRVKSITRHYDGDYDVFCNRTQNTTTIRVMFPKYNSHE